jgi:hypothetical protein
MIPGGWRQYLAQGAEIDQKLEIQEQQMKDIHERPQPPDQ